MNNNSTNINIENAIINLPTASNITYSWNFGSILGLTLSIQILTGILISIHYNPSPSQAFQSYIYLSRNINNGFFINLTHSIGASTFFILILTHIFRAINNNSYNNNNTWLSGNIIFLTLIATAFLGYVLPWGQISLWGATVITNLISTIPLNGEFLNTWIWGGFNVNNPTLNRFFSIHFLLPLLLSILSLIHISLLHENGSSSNINLNTDIDNIPFNNNFSLNDLNTIIILIIIILLILSTNSFILIDPVNFSPANPLSTPDQIIPEWYFLFAYAILRSIPNNTGGVTAIAISIFILTIITLNNSNLSNNFNPISNTANSLNIANFFILTFLGSNEIEQPFTNLSLIFTSTYFPIIII